MDDQLAARQARLGANQSLFRDVNEQVERLSGEPAAGEITFVCECASPECSETIPLHLEAYEAVRANSTHFFVLSDHVFPEVEDVIDDRGDYVIVEKQALAAGSRKRPTPVRANARESSP
jgi:hypothetical protein